MYRTFILYLIFVIADIATGFLIFLPLKWSWVIAITGHMIIALAASFWIYSESPDDSLDRKKIVILFSFIFLFPVISLLTLWFLSAKDIFRKKYKHKLKQRQQEDTDSQEPYDFLEQTKLLHDPNKYKKTRSLLSTLNDENYLKLLLASRHLPDKEAYALLSEALVSPFESARLMAFSLKEKLEKRLQGELQKDLKMLQGLSGVERAEQHLVVAKEYMHLFDIGMFLMSEEKLLEEALYHCHQAIKLDRTSAYAFHILSRILLYQGKTNKSREAKKIAASLQRRVLEKS